MRSRYSRYSKISEDTSALGYLGATAAGAAAAPLASLAFNKIYPAKALKPLSEIAAYSPYEYVLPQPIDINGVREITRSLADPSALNAKYVNGNYVNVLMPSHKLRNLAIGGGASALALLLARNAVTNKMESEGRNYDKMSPLAVGAVSGLLAANLSSLERQTLHLAQEAKAGKVLDAVGKYIDATGRNSFNSSDFMQMDLPWSYRAGNKLKANIINAGIMGTLAGGIGLVAHIINTKKKKNALAAESDQIAV